jgi:hypothetical protein
MPVLMECRLKKEYARFEVEALLVISESEDRVSKPKEVSNTVHSSTQCYNPISVNRHQSHSANLKSLIVFQSSVCHGVVPFPAQTACTVSIGLLNF